MDGCSPLFSPMESPWSIPSQTPSLFDPDYSLTSSSSSIPASRRKLSICTTLNNLSIHHRSQPSSSSTPSTRYHSEPSTTTSSRTPHNTSTRSTSRSKTPRTISHTLSTDVRLQRMLLSQIQAMAPQTIAPRIPLSSPRSSRASSEDLTDSDNDATWKRIQASRSAPGSFSATKSESSKITKSRKKRTARLRKREDGAEESKWRFQRGSSAWI